MEKAPVPHSRAKACHSRNTNRSTEDGDFRAYAEAKAQAGSLARLDGKSLFKAHDTYGLRPDFVQTFRDTTAEVDLAGYNAEMEKQRERARASWKGAEKKTASPVYLEVVKEQESTFDGYQQVRSEKCQVVALVRKGEIVNDVKPGEQVEIVLDHTPFYAEAGGQVGDTGKVLRSGQRP